MAEAACLTPDALLRQKRVTSLVASKNGRWLAFAVKQYDWEASRWSSRIHVHDRQTNTNSITGGSSEKDVVKGGSSEKDVVNDHSPTWMADNQTIVFLSDRGGNGSQLWQVDINEDAPSQLTHLALPIASYRVHDGIGAIVFSTKVERDQLNPFQATLKADRKKAKQKAQFFKYDRLFVRRWDQWNDGRISKLFLLFFTRFGMKYTAIGTAIYMMDKADPDEQCPMPPFGDSSHYDISPDGKQIVYCSHRYSSSSDQAWTTFTSLKTLNLDIQEDYVLQTTQPVDIPCDGQGYNFNPTYCSDGKYIAFLSMERAGYEADWHRIAIYDRTQAQLFFLQHAPVSAKELVWSPKCNSLFVTGNHKARTNAYQVPLNPESESSLLAPGGEVHCIVPVETGEAIELAYLKNCAVYPDRVFFGAECISDPNELGMIDIKLPELEEMWYNGSNQDKVHAWFIRPFGFTAKRKWPLVHIIHGGPQGSINDNWHYRWNLGIFASAGYAVMAVNFHGSSSFGQAFCDSIQGDWGGKPYDDIMLGLDHALKTYEWIDSNRVGALGASYGGYMINWINGHTDRFRCFVNHDGLFNTENMYYATEELYFMERDFEGTPWISSNYRKWSPHEFVDKWQTPTLVIHGGKDYRVVDCEGLSTFTALQRRGVPSEFLYFPSEGHWVLDPNNSLVWHETVLQWLSRWLK